MNSALFLPLIGLVLFPSTAAEAQTAPSEIIASTPKDHPVKEKRICRSEEVTGSVVEKRVCHTKGEWSAIDTNQENATESSQRANWQRYIAPAGH